MKQILPSKPDKFWTARPRRGSRMRHMELDVIQGARQEDMERTSDRAKGRQAGICSST